MRGKYVFLLGVLLVSQGALALQFPPLLELKNKEQSISLPIENDGNVVKEITLTAQKISFPAKGYKVLDKSAKELKIYPSSLMLQPGQRGFFHIISKKDAKEERYFHLNIMEQGNESAEIVGKSGRKGNVHFPLQVRTTLVIRALHPLLRYELNGNRFHNLSNGYVVLMQDRQCGRVRGRTDIVAPNHWADLMKNKDKLVVAVGLVDQLKIIRDYCA